MGEPDKDKIKEILEGHNKRFTATELIVGIIVILLIGTGVGYALFKIFSPPTQPNEYTHIEENLQNEVQNNNTIEEQPYKETQAETEKQNLPQQTPQQTQKYSQQEEIQTPAIQQTEKAQTQQGPQIVNPYKEQQTSNSEQKQAKTEITRHKEAQSITANTSVKKAKKHITHKTITARKKHKTILKKYILQVSSNSNRKLALLTTIKLRKCGHNAFTKEVTIKGKTYTRVMVGPIEGYQAAKEEAKNIKKQLHLKYTPIIKRYDKVS
ncbi:SPOR domain-containing protein [Hippea maritima]|uniref:Sporulation domain-containing protein n=1 Tax=Hippea maritima (strain ATCC 700847 / DSM 10411 / MH2) TaxID=760142 RepID=F2LW02_HIPMA|nr:SPOR domain-containing protein [Hippea maritima]AEA33936.1 Sporulation domain-containing protein [Hippea maritima DSM 10411]